MSTVLTFEELAPGAQIGISTTDRGVISGTAQDPGTIVAPLQLNPIAQLLWVVDFVNGNDSTGTGSAAAPLKTWARALQIWGLNADWNAGAYRFVSLADVLLANNDLIYVPGILRRNSTFIFASSLTPGVGQSVLYTSVAGMTAATAMSRTTGSGTRPTITDAAVPTGTWAGAGLISTNAAPNKRIRLTDGARPGAVAFPQRDEGAGKVDVSPWILPVVLNGPILAAMFSTASFNVAGTEHFVVEKLTTVDMLIVDAVVENDGTTNTGICSIACDSLNVISYTMTKPTTAFQGRTMFFWGCASLTPVPASATAAIGAFYQSSQTKGGNFVQGGTNINCVACHQTTRWAPGAGCSLTLDGDTIAEGVPITDDNGRGQVTIGTAASFNSTTSGMICSGEQNTRTTSSVYQTGGLLWGSGAADVGLNVRSGARFQIRNPFTFPGACPSITGTAGDFRLGGLLTARSWIEATAAYTAAIATTWANLAAAQPAGLGQSAANLNNFAFIFVANQ